MSFASLPGALLVIWLLARGRIAPARRWSLTANAFFFVGAVTVAQAATFQGLGTIAEGTPSYALEISADGGSVLGYTDTYSSGSLEQPSFLWTQRNGRLDLGLGVAALSGDGTTVVGTHETAFGVTELHRWTAATGWLGIGNPTGTENSTALDVSADGSVVFGRSEWILGPTIEQLLFRWTADDGFEIIDGVHPAYLQLMSDDGLVVAGSRSVPGAPDHAFRWSVADGVVSLGSVPGGGSTYPTAISSDASVVVGLQENVGGTRAFRWSEPTGIQDLGDGKAWAVSSSGALIAGYTYGQPAAWTETAGLTSLGTLPGTNSGIARAVSDTGLVVGWVADAQRSDRSDTVAFVWDEPHGIRDLKAVLETEYGLDLTGWLLKDAFQITDDGLAIAGDGTNPAGIAEGWLAWLGEPTVLKGDYNGNGLVEQSDLDLVLLNWGHVVATPPGGWINQPPSGQIDQQELDSVLLNWGDTYSAASVPEPTGGILAVLMGIASGWLRKLNFRGSIYKATRDKRHANKFTLPPGCGFHCGDCQCLGIG